MGPGCVMFTSVRQVKDGRVRGRKQDRKVAGLPQFLLFPPEIRLKDV